MCLVTLKTQKDPSLKRFGIEFIPRNLQIGDAIILNVCIEGGKTSCDQF